MTSRLHIFLCLALAAMLAACKNRPAEGILGKGQMVDLLYDYHLAQALASNAGDSTDYKLRLYAEAVYRKHGISEREFNKNMEYYSRHADALYEIYEKVNARFGTEATPSGMAKGMKEASGDTINIWAGRNCYLLSAMGQNYQEYELKADSAFRPGDKLEWQFDTQWIYHDGAKSGSMLITVTYEGDSVATTQRPLFGSGRQMLAMYLGAKKVKHISLLIYQQSDRSDRPRMLLVSAPSLLLIHGTAEPQQPTVSKSDSIREAALQRRVAEQKIQDSLIREDKAERPHFVGNEGLKATPRKKLKSASHEKLRLRRFEPAR